MGTGEPFLPTTILVLELDMSWGSITLVLSVCLSSAGCSSSSGTDPSDAPPGPYTTNLTGTLGALGAVKPTVSSLMISNSGETLIYLSSATLTCDQLKVSRWLGAATAGSQVIELIVSGAPSVKSYDVPPGEVNFAEGGKSSATEVSADSGTIRFTVAEAMGTVEGTVAATYGSNNIHGTFHATYCAGGQGY